MQFPLQLPSLGKRVNAQKLKDGDVKFVCRILWKEYSKASEHDKLSIKIKCCLVVRGLFFIKILCMFSHSRETDPTCLDGGGSKTVYFALRGSASR